jgi:hypothetical protein
MFVFIYNFHVLKIGIIGMVFIENLGFQLGAGCFGHVVKTEAVGLKDSKKKKVGLVLPQNHFSSDNFR